MNLPVGDGFSVRTSTVSVLESMSCSRSGAWPDRTDTQTRASFCFCKDTWVEQGADGVCCVHLPLHRLVPAILAFFEEEQVFGFARQVLANRFHFLQLAFIIIPLFHVNRDGLMEDVDQTRTVVVCMLPRFVLEMKQLEGF